MTTANSPTLRDHAVAIWRTGVSAVESQRLVGNVIHRNANELTVAGHRIDVERLEKLVVVGAGKAGTGMATAIQDRVGVDVAETKLTGWVNVPADCIRPLDHIHLHAARPAGINEPTEDGVTGSREILKLVSQLDEDDVCIIVLSGGGSALLPCPVDAISLADKQAVTRWLMHAGANIGELNKVRKQLSQIKGGRLAQASRAGLTIALIISDVIGDPLDVIASGPTVPDPSTPADALDVLQRFATDPASIPATVWRFLEKAATQQSETDSFPDNVHTHVIGNNDVALQAAADRAKSLGYTVHSLGSNNAGEARQVGVDLAQLAVAIRDHGEPVGRPACILSGGEPIVQVMPTSQPRKGGRNQEAVLAAMQSLWNDGLRDIVVLSGGTDGEDGPTDAAGAIADSELLAKALSLELQPAEFLAINNSYHFFAPIDGLLKTGPTHTNVMDLRVVLIG